jgi:c-di-GMP-binding flagellar brake protein YcgR
MRKNKMPINRTTIYNFALLCALFVMPALSQERRVDAVTQMKWPEATPGVIIGLIAVFGTGLGILISAYMNTRRKNTKNEVTASERLFNEGCVRCELTVEEAKLLREIVAYAPEASTKAHTIFDTFPLFELCVNAYINRSLSETDSVDTLLHSVRKKLGYGTITPEQPLMSTRNLIGGQKVIFSIGSETQGSAHPFDLVAVAPAGSDNGREMQGRRGVVSYVGEFYFTVRLGEGRLSDKSDSLTISLLRQGDAAYVIPVSVKEWGGHELSFFHTLKFTRNQSRNYMRYDISLPIKFRLLESGSVGLSDEKKDAKTFQAQTFDIGGGGLSFITDKPFIAGDTLLMSLQIPGRSMGGLKARVLKIIPVEGKTATQYKHLLQFTVIEPQQREHIVKFIFEKQREALQMR